MSLSLSYKLKCLCNHPRRCVNVIKRFVQRKYPVDRDIEFGLPVFQYPVCSSDDRRVYVWGISEHGALGNRLQSKTTKKFKKRLPEYHYKPLRLTFGEQIKVTDVACGYGFTIFAADTKGKDKVFGCGINNDSQIGYHAPRRDHPLGLLLSPSRIELPLKPETKVQGVAAGRAHTMVLTDSQGVFTLGNNAHGQCGRLVVENEEYTGSRVVHHISSLGTTNAAITAVHCGQDHSLFVTSEGEVFSCGWGADGQLGLGDYNSQWRPSQVSGDLLHERIIKVAGQGDCVLALNDKGEVFGWGNNEYKQLSDNGIQQVCSPMWLTNTRGMGKIVDITAGGSICAALNEDGGVFVWGYGLLGLGPKVEKSSKPLEIPRTLFGENLFMKDSKVTRLSSGLYHLAAVTNHGQLYMWGRNKGGCLGLGHINDQYFPLKVNIGAQVTKISAGVDHTVTLCKPFT